MNAKICPLRSITGGLQTECKGERCAWFYGDRCAILELAMNTSDIQTVADMIDYRGGGGA